jgi:hypothetical protein
MTRQVTEAEAWADFWTWIKMQPVWLEMTLQEKRYINRAAWDSRRGGLGPVRIRTILERYGNGRYTFTTAVIIKE